MLTAIRIARALSSVESVARAKEALSVGDVAWREELDEKNALRLTDFTGSDANSLLDRVELVVHGRSR